MSQSIGVGIIARNAGATIKECVKSLAPFVEQIVVVLAGESTDNTAKEAKKGSKKVELYKFDWIQDFSAARNFCFSKLHTDWYLWVDADDWTYQAENLRSLVEQAQEKVGAIWFPYHYAVDEFGNLTTVYERERLLRAKYGWIWKGRLHETVEPLRECLFVRSDDVIMKHNHLTGGERNTRNFSILDIMYSENPDDKRVWLYYGHQNFAVGRWMESSKWYLKFGTDKGAIQLERYQALCYCAKALRTMKDPQAIDVSLMAIELYPNYKDAYLELAHSYLIFNDFDKALHWAFLSDTKELIKEPPRIIFVNPLEYTFNKFCLIAECYLKKGMFEESLKYLGMAKQIRPTPDFDKNAKMVQDLLLKEKISNSIKTLAVHLLNNKELIKLSHLPEVIPFWFKDSPEYKELKGGIDHYTQEMKPHLQLTEIEDSVEANLDNVFDVPALLDELDKKYDRVKVTSFYPTPERTQINIMSQYDLEHIVAKEGRHIINLQKNEDGLFCEYDKKLPTDLHVRMFLGQGLENWNPQTIRDNGCGGSETAAAWVCRELAKRNCQPIIYAMDNQVWDGVIYRPYFDFKPDSIGSHLFISSRVPELFNQNIPSLQRWLWFHDIHRWDKFTPAIAENIDVLLLLSQWHANFVKATYPFLKDAEVIDLDNNELTYNDCEAPNVWFANEKVSKLPKIAIIGNGIDIERFDVVEKRIPHRFIWCSSPDRGLEQVLEMWSMIKAELPDAELKIFYGWEYFDHALVIPQYREHKERLRRLLEQPGVEWCGRIGQEQIAKELCKADIMLYPPPHDFRETYGIAFLEAQAAGVLCLYRKNGALGETIGSRGIPIELNATKEEIVKLIVETLKDETSCDIMRERAKEYARGRTWGVQTEKFLQLYRRLNAN